MYGFEITEQDVIQAFEKGFDETITEDQATKVLAQLNKQAASDAANFQGDMDKAAEQAGINIVSQITFGNLDLSCIYGKNAK